MRRRGEKRVTIAGVTVALKPPCPVDHESMRASLVEFVGMTERLPHHQSDEATVDGGDDTRHWYRNCRSCRSTIIFVLATEARRAA